MVRCNYIYFGIYFGIYFEKWFRVMQDHAAPARTSTSTRRLGTRWSVITVTAVCCCRCNPPMVLLSGDLLACCCCLRWCHTILERFWRLLAGVWRETMVLAATGCPPWPSFSDAGWDGAVAQGRQGNSPHVFRAGLTRQRSPRRNDENSTRSPVHPFTRSDHPTRQNMFLFSPGGLRNPCSRHCRWRRWSAHSGLASCFSCHQRGGTPSPICATRSASRSKLASRYLERITWCLLLRLYAVNQD